MSMPYSSREKIRKGPCNICQTVTELSKDHIPPKGGIPRSNRSVTIEPVYPAWVGDARLPHREFSQTGVWFQTLCKACNNRLGREYDPAIHAVANTVRSQIEDATEQPTVVTIKTKPALLIRGILGHLLAAKSAPLDHTFDRSIRPVIFDLARPIPTNMYLYCYYYPFPKILIQTDIMVAAAPNPIYPPVYCSFLKYSPVAYVLTDATSFYGMTDLTEHRDLGPDNIVEFRLDLNPPEAPEWPENTWGVHVVTCGTGDALIAKPKKPQS